MSNWQPWAKRGYWTVEEHNAVLAELERMGKSNNEACDRVAELETLNDALVKDLNFYRDEYQPVSAVRYAAEARVQELEAECKRWIAKNNRLVNECADARQRIAELEAEHTEAFTRIAELEAQLAVLHDGETVEGVVMERDHYRIKLEKAEQDLAAVPRVHLKAWETPLDLQYSPDCCVRFHANDIGFYVTTTLRGNLCYGNMGAVPPADAARAALWLASYAQAHGAPVDLGTQPAPIADAKTLYELAEIGFAVWAGDGADLREESPLINDLWQRITTAILLAALPRVDNRGDYETLDALKNRYGWNSAARWDKINSRIRYGVELPPETPIATSAPTDAQIEVLARVLYAEYSNMDLDGKNESIHALWIRTARAAYAHIGAELTAATAERDDLRAELAARTMRPVKVRWAWEDNIELLTHLAKKNRLSPVHLEHIAESIAAHAVIDVPPGVPSVEQLQNEWKSVPIGDKVYDEDFNFEFEAIRITHAALLPYLRGPGECQECATIQKLRAELAAARKWNSETLAENNRLDKALEVERDRCTDLLSDKKHLEDQLAARATRPVKVRFDVTAGDVSAFIFGNSQSHKEEMSRAMHMLLHHAVIDVPPGVPTLEQLAELIYSHVRTGRNYATSEPELKAAAAAIRDAVLAGLPTSEPAPAPLSVEGLRGVLEDVCGVNTPLNECIIDVDDSDIPDIHAALLPYLRGPGECQECAKWKAQSEQYFKDFCARADQYDKCKATLSAVRAALEGES